MQVTTVQTTQHKFLLFLTATITPFASGSLARRDPNLRRQDYYNAFTYWLNHSDPRLMHILFAENSGADLTEFHQAAEKSCKSVEVISLNAASDVIPLHYGYFELQMIDQALAQSSLRQKTSHMIKATGRLVFPDLPKLLNRLPATVRLAVDSRSRLPFRPSANNFVSTQLFIASHDFYDMALRHSYHSLAPIGQYPSLIEHLFFEQLLLSKRSSDVLLRFPVNCEPIGFAGSSGKTYRSLSRLMAARARAISRFVMPDIWL